MNTMISPALMIAGCLTASTVLAEGKPELIVLAPDHFASEWGPGARIESGFESRCGCNLRFVTGDLLSRLRLDGGAGADAVIGLSTDQTAATRATGLFAPDGPGLSVLTLPVAWTDLDFVAFNRGETAFVYDRTRLSDPPESFRALIDAPDELKIVIQAPRTSAPGLALALWIDAIYDDGAVEVWRKLRPKILTVTPGWSESRSLFTAGDADMVMSCTTSPAYHLIAEKDDTRRAAILPEGHYFMAEPVGWLRSADQPELAGQFMDHVLSEDFRKMIPTANWTYPAVMVEGALAPESAAHARPEKTLFLPKA